MTIASNPSSLTDETLNEQLGAAIGRIATGVYVVTVKRDGVLDGMLTSWICQAAFEPPMLTVAVKSERPLLKHLTVGSDFAVNVIAKNNMDIFKTFAKPYTDGLDRFEHLKVDNELVKQPVFSDCLAYMLCQVKELIESGDHYLALAQIRKGAVLNAQLEPMVHLRKNGFQY